MMSNVEKIKEQRVHASKGARNTNSKNIFYEPMLYAQFLRDNLKVPVLQNIRPEDIEDVSEQYSPYLGIEFESDTVKKIRIRDASGEQMETPLYLISLTEHKSQVDYNVSMQLLKYMACIWQEYAKEQERKNPGCSRKKDFRYPPILPVVYYEGKPKWTAAIHLKDRVMLNEIFQDCIPAFTYEVVRLHDYGNEELLERGDEMSLIMMFNKIQDAMDLEEFLEIPTEKLNGIIKDTPEYIIEVIASVMKALCVKIGATEEETDQCIQKVRERKMGYLFENMEKMNIQEERKLRAEAEKRAEEAEEAVKEAEKRKEEAVMQGIIETCQELGVSKEVARDKLIEKYKMSQVEAEQETEKYWK